MALVDLVNENHKTFKKALIALWFLAVILFFVDMFSFFPGIGITKTFVYMATAMLFGLAGMSAKVLASSSDDDFMDYDSPEEMEYVSPMTRIVNLTLGLGLSVLFVGVLFKTMHWPGANVMLPVGCFSAIGGALLGLTNKNTRKFAIAAILTAVLLGGMTFSGLRDEIKFRDYPELVAAQKEFYKNPNSLEARARLDYEGEKYNRGRSGLVLPQEIEEAYQQFLADPTDANYNNFSYAIFKFRR
ncbi:MAG: hypothetical protein MJZ19_07505 [Paludibacteraceae bacterium]|nr:hypothetical protein [Paludibacteraceae bacterium]